MNENMSKEKVYELIQKWGNKEGESFFDCFCHDNVNDKSWAFFLFGKGYKKHASMIIDQILEGVSCIDQDILYEVKPRYFNDEYIRKNDDFNHMIMAEFISCTRFYSEKFLKFIKYV